jgi:hypothetical protein
MAWLSGFRKRLTLNIDPTKIDEHLTDFPVMIALSSGTGLSNANVADVADYIPTGSGTQDPVVKSGYYSYFTMETVSGTTVYSEGAGTNGTLVSNVSQTFSDKAFGTYSAFFTTDKTDRITISNAFNQTEGTISFWLRTSKTSGTQHLVTTEVNGSTGRHHFSLDSSGAFFIGEWQGTESLSTENGFNDDAWHHVVFVWAPTGRQIWCDGDELTISNSTSTFGYGYNGVMSIGSHPYTYGSSGNDDFEGYIDEFVVYKTSLPQIEIQQLYYHTPVHNLAVTTDDGTTECYTELAYYNAGDKRAELWTKVPFISKDYLTTLYLYYDTDLTTSDYFGETGSLAAANVWDTLFVGVWHLNSRVNGGGGTNDVLDSTANPANGDSYGTIGLTSKEGGFVFDLNGTNAYVDCGGDSKLQVQNYITAEAYLKHGQPGSSTLWAIVGCQHDTGSNGWQMHVDGRNNGGLYGTIHFQIGNGGWAGYNSAALVPINEWYHLAGARSVNDQFKFYYDGVKVGNSTSTSWAGTINYTHNIQIGRQPGSGGPRLFTGSIKEVRISNTERSAAWVKASAHSVRDELITVEGYHTSGYVKLNGSPAARRVRLYDGEMGRLMDSTTSHSGTGYYELTTAISGTHYLVCLDDNGAVEYAHLISPDITPGEV